MYGKKIKSLRLTSNLTQADLADRLNVPRSNISAWESLQYPPLEVIEKICSYFKVSLPDFFNNGTGDITNLDAEEVEFLREYKDLPVDLKGFIWQAVKVTQEAYFAGLKRRV